MRLLDKKMVSATLATQRKQDIDAGVKIAEKVDAVRDTLAKEEKRLSEFRTLSVAHVQTEIDTKLREKNGVEREIMVRKEELRKLREPLDVEWATVQETKTALSWQKQELYEKQRALDDGLRLNIQRERLNAEEQQRIEVLRIETNVSHETATEAKKEAFSVLKKAQTTANTMLLDAKQREEAVEVREDSADLKEEWIKQQEKKLAKRDKEQDNRDRLIKDKYETLLRTQARLKK